MKSNFNAFILSLILLLSPSFALQIFSQSITLEDMITYNKQSNFIKEFQIPVEGFGLGITTDTDGIAWFYHSTDNTSTIFKLDPKNGSFVYFYSILIVLPCDCFRSID